MKIYLLMLLIGTLLTLIRFTAAPERKSEPAQQSIGPPLGYRQRQYPRPRQNLRNLLLVWH